MRLTLSLKRGEPKLADGVSEVRRLQGDWDSQTEVSI